MKLIFVDVEASGPAPCVGKMTEFGAVIYDPDSDYYISYHGSDDSKETMESFLFWLEDMSSKPHEIKANVLFISDNPAFDWQFINDAFWKHGIPNPFGHSARRIGDFYAGCVRDFWKASSWKSWRKTPHDHNPVHDALGNVEAFKEILRRFPKES